MFPSLAARETCAETNFAARKQKMFLSGFKNIFASRTQILRPKHMFPSLATPGNITRNIVSATKFPSLTRPLKLLIRKFHVVIWQRMSNNCTKVRAARAARLFVLIQPIRSLFSGMATRTCGTIIFSDSTNQIIVFWHGYSPKILTRWLPPVKCQPLKPDKNKIIVMNNTNK